MQHKEKIIAELKKKDLIRDDEVYRLVVEHDKKQLEKVKKEFEESYKELKKKGKLDSLGFA